MWDKMAAVLRNGTASSLAQVACQRGRARESGFGMSLLEMVADERQESEGKIWALDDTKEGPREGEGSKGMVRVDRKVLVLAGSVLPCGTGGVETGHDLLRVLDWQDQDRAGEVARRRRRRRLEHWVRWQEGVRRGCVREGAEWVGTK